MKKIFTIAVAALLTLGGTTSCTDFLDTHPFDKITGDDTWSSDKLTEAYVYSLYASVMQSTEWMGNYGHVYAMRSEPCSKNAMQGTLNQLYWASQSAENITHDDNFGWINYSVLWRIHTAMEELAKNTTFKESFKQQMDGELRFLRAAHYFLYARQYGGLQIIDRVLTTDDEMQIPRATAGETYDFIIKDLEEAANELPAHDAVERGRASKEACYALLMRACLQAAAYVDGGKADSKYYTKVIDAGNKLGLDDNGSKLSPYYDMFRDFETAIDAQEQIMVVELSSKNTSLYGTPMQYQGLWYDGHISDYAKKHFPVNVTMNFWGMDGGSWPTQDLVDDYMVTDTDGKIKDWDEASYVQTGRNVDEKMYFSDTHKRDLRFYATVLYDSCMYFNNKVRVFFRRDGNVSNANSKINEGSYEEYGYKAGDINNYNSSTGYAMVKYQYDDIESFAEPYKKMLDFCFSVFRYGEAYLNMAEAYLMKNDWANARRYMIPTMVKHGGFTREAAEQYLADKTGKDWNDDLFRAYMRERNVEMVYENNDRYWSLLRWGMRKSGGIGNGSYATNGFVIPELQGVLHGIRISRDGGSYQMFECTNPTGEAQFTPKRYLLPINYSFCQKSGVEQNPGWE